MKEGWTYIALSSFCKVQNGFAFNSKLFNESNNGLPLIRIRDIKRGYSLTYTDETCSDEFFVEDGDMLIGMDGDFNIGEWKGGHALLNQRVCKLIPSEKILAKFVFYFIPEALQRINDKTAFSTVKHLSSKQVNAILLPNIPLSEQKSIVDYLDSAFAKIDAMKANSEKALNEAKALFQASLKELLEPKEGWEERKLQEVASDFSRGKSKHRPRNDKKLFGGKYPFIQTGEIRNANVYVTSHSSTYNEIGLSQSKLWPKDTVCITIAANIAEVAILKYPSCFPDSVIGFVANNNKVDKMFVFYSLLNYQQELKKQGKGSAQDNINLGTFENNRFPFPSLQEQQSIVTTLDSLKSKVDRLQANYDKISQECDALKQAILRQVFE